MSSNNRCHASWRFLGILLRLEGWFVPPWLRGSRWCVVRALGLGCFLHAIAGSELVEDRRAGFESLVVTLGVMHVGVLGTDLVGLETHADDDHNELTVFDSTFACVAAESAL
jgi:hypothetical protein